MAHEPSASEVLPVLLAEQRRFAAFLERRVKDASTAEDVLQSAFATVLARKSAPRDPARIVPWFFRILRRSLIDRSRRDSARRRALEGRRQLSQVEKARLRSLVCECVTALAQTLPPEQRQILLRVEVDGDSVREAASKLGITPNNAAVRAHRARAALLRRVQDLCGACSEHRCLRCRCESSRGKGAKRRPVIRGGPPASAGSVKRGTP